MWVTAMGYPVTFMKVTVLLGLCHFYNNFINYKNNFLEYQIENIVFFIVFDTSILWKCWGKVCVGSIAVTLQLHSNTMGKMSVKTFNSPAQLLLN